MKVGLILECGPMGADKHVCEALIARIDNTIEIETVTLSNKPGLIENCGTAAAQLIASGCDRVVIVWDLYPAWRTDGVRPCRHQDRTEIFAKLHASNVTNLCFLVCIEEELETWLLADDRAINAVLSRPTRPTNIRINVSERVRKPKTRLNGLFKEHGRRPYNDLVDAKRIVNALPDLQRLRRMNSFKRFVLKVADQVI